MSGSPVSASAPKVSPAAQPATTSGSSRSRARNTTASVTAMITSAATSSTTSEWLSSSPRSESTTGAPVVTYRPPPLSRQSGIATAPRTSAIASRRSSSDSPGFSRT